MASLLQVDVMEPIAIIGLDGKFPGAESPDELWALLREARQGICQQSRWDPAFIDKEMLKPNSMVSDRLGQIPSFELFDDEFFGFKPGEAEAMDPQQRLLLEVTWRALEHGGQLPTQLGGSRVGVWIAAGATDYRSLAWRSPEGLTAHSVLGTELSMLANGVSQRFDLHGPSTVVDAGCSSVPVGLEYACRLLSAGELDLALVGAANVVLDPCGSVALSEAWMLSARGECRPFDEGADGYVRGDGIAMAVLRPLEKALSNGDPVLAVVRSAAVCHCGRSEGDVSEAITMALRSSLAMAGVEPSDIGYVEAHAVGSPALDAAELSALSEVFSGVRLGSSKANVGHLEWASGMASIAKLCAMFRHHEMPPQIHLDDPIAALDPAVFEVVREVTGFTARFAATNTVSVGGVCATVVLEAPPPPPSRTRDAGRPHLVAMSAPDQNRLMALGKAWARSQVELADAAWTLATRRERFEVRGACVADDVTMIAPRICQPAKGTVWAFTGQGSQRAGMGLSAAAQCAAFATALEEVGAALYPHLGVPIAALLTHPELDDTRLCQPAVFALQYALAETWSAWGLRPTAVLGHSVGEIAACVVAGILTLEDAAEFIVIRGRLMSELPRDGGMLAVFGQSDHVESLLTPRLAIAAINGPEWIVVSGLRSELSNLADRLEQEGIGTAPLLVSHGFHSPLMEPILAPLAEAASRLTSHEGQVPLYSTVLCEPLRRLPPGYWTRHAKETVRFGPGVQSLMPGMLVIEIGPGGTLVQHGRRVRPDLDWVSSMSAEAEWRGLLDAAGRAWAAGCELDIGSIESGGAGRVIHGPGTFFAPRSQRFSVGGSNRCIPGTRVDG